MLSTDRRRLKRRLEAQRRRIDKRLADAVALNVGGPVLAGAPIRYELSERSRGTAHGGMGMIAGLVEEVGLAAEIDASVEVLKCTAPTTSPTMY